MPDRIALAARNNAHWVDAVCRSHGIHGSFDDDAWTAPMHTPPYYPDAVTLAPDVDRDDLLARIDASDGCSVKDSWARLDLTSDDFAQLATGQWLWHEPTSPSTAQGDSRVWRRVEDGDEMRLWLRAWSHEPDAEGILRTTLLDEPGVHVLAARDSHDGDAPVVAGGIVNVTGEVAGLGNLFSQDGDQERTWRGALRTVRDLVGGLPVVGWEAGDGIRAATAAGCEQLGPLTVWVR